MDMAVFNLHIEFQELKYEDSSSHLHNNKNKMLNLRDQLMIQCNNKFHSYMLYWHLLKQDIIPQSKQPHGTWMEPVIWLVVEDNWYGWYGLLKARVTILQYCFSVPANGETKHCDNFHYNTIHVLQHKLL
jgi:hypothetical protein